MLAHRQTSLPPPSLDPLFRWNLLRCWYLREIKCSPYLTEIQLLVTDLDPVHLNCLFMTHGMLLFKTNERLSRECFAIGKVNKTFSTTVTAFLISSGINCLLESYNVLLGDALT